MVNCNDVVEIDQKLLIMFKCPSFSKAGLMCVFASMKDRMGGDRNKGLKCRSSACAIRLPKEANNA